MQASASRKKQINHACFVKQLVSCGKTADELCKYFIFFHPTVVLQAADNVTFFYIYLGRCFLVCAIAVLDV